MITCPICNKLIKKVYQHLNQTEAKHKQLLLEQEQLVLKSFEDYNFNKNNIAEYEILFDYTTCLRIYSENVDEETRKIRANKARSIKSSKGLKKYHATKKLDKTYCPICRKKSKRIYSHLIYTLSDNTNDLYKEHYNFFKNQLKIIYNLFFDFNFNKTETKDGEGSKRRKERGLFFFLIVILHEDASRGHSALGNYTTWEAWQTAQKQSTGKTCALSKHQMVMSS